MTDEFTFVTRTGEVLTDADIYALAEEFANNPPDVSEWRPRGRPRLGDGPSRSIPVRLEPELDDALRARARADHTTNSAVIRAALRSYLAQP